MKKIFLLFISLYSLNIIGQTSSSTKALIDSNLPTNGIKAITATDLRTTLKAMVDFTDTKSAISNSVNVNTELTLMGNYQSPNKNKLTITNKGIGPVPNLVIEQSDYTPQGGWTSLGEILNIKNGNWGFAGNNDPAATIDLGIGGTLKIGNLAGVGKVLTSDASGNATWSTSPLDAKIDKISGKSLSTNDFTNTYKAKVDSISLKAPINNPSFSGTITGITANITGNSTTNGTSTLNGLVSFGGSARFGNEQYQYWQDRDGAYQKMLGLDWGGNFLIGDINGYFGYGSNTYKTTGSHIFNVGSSTKLRMTSGATYLYGDLNFGTNAATSLITALSNKVDNISGKGLSTNDFTNTYKAKVDSVTFKQSILNGTGFVKSTGGTISYDNSTYLTSSALSPYLTSSTASSTYATQTNLALKANLASPNFTGNVGINSSSPTSRFEINDTNGIPLKFGDITTSITGQLAGFIGISTTAYNGNNGDLVLYPRTNSPSNILFMGNRVGISTATPQGILDVVSTTAPSYPFPRMTTAQRTALTGMGKGAYVFDTDFNHPYYYSGTAWVQQ